jgi:hypothetical protein
LVDALIELRLQLLFVFLPLDGRGLRRALFGVGARGDDEVLELRLPLGARLVEFRSREVELRAELALGLHRRVAARVFDRNFVLVFECGELLIERPSQLGLQIVERHRDIIPPFGRARGRLIRSHRRSSARAPAIRNLRRCCGEGQTGPPPHTRQA